MKLTVEHGSFAYEKHRALLTDVSFSAQSGQTVAVLGPNGAGKTTLLRCVTGLLRWQTGRTALDGTDITALPNRSLWQRIAYVPQARGEAAALTAREMILLGCTNRTGVFSAPDAAQTAQAEALAHALGIGALLDRRCSALSGGELQMVRIARALAAQPELLVLDEPESGLDLRNQLVVLDALQEQTRAGLCCLFNTHYPDHALQRADRVLLLGPGGAVFGTPEAVLTQENLRCAFGVEAVVGRVGGHPAIVPVRALEKGDRL